MTALLRETGRPVTLEQADKFQKLHAEAYMKQVQQVQPLPGAKDLLKSLTKARVQWAIATSGRIAFARPSLDALEVPASVPIITRDQVERAKPDPDLFLAAAAKLGVDIADSIVVGDSVWDLLAARRAAGFGSGSFIWRLWAGRVRARRRLSRLTGSLRSVEASG